MRLAPLDPSPPSWCPCLEAAAPPPPLHIPPVSSWVPSDYCSPPCIECCPSPPRLYIFNASRASSIVAVDTSPRPLPSLGLLTVKPVRPVCLFSTDSSLTSRVNQPSQGIKQLQLRPHVLPPSPWTAPKPRTAYSLLGITKYRAIRQPIPSSLTDLHAPNSRVLFRPELSSTSSPSSYTTPPRPQQNPAEAQLQLQQLQPQSNPLTKKPDFSVHPAHNG